MKATAPLTAIALMLSTTAVFAQDAEMKEPHDANAAVVMTEEHDDAAPMTDTDVEVHTPENHENMADAVGTMSGADMMASDLIGASLYHTQVEMEDEVVETNTTDPAGSPVATTSAMADVDREAVADVDDIVISSDGQVVGYIADVGGFLGMGEKSVLLDVSAIDVSWDEEDPVLTINLNEEELKALPDYDDMRE